MPENLPAFDPTKWTLEQKIARLRLLAPECVKALDVLATGALKDRWPIQPDPKGRGRKRRGLPS